MARALHSAVLGLCLATAVLAAKFRPFLHRHPRAVGLHSLRALEPGPTEPPSPFWPTPPPPGQPSYFWQASPEQQPSYFWSAPPTPPTPPTAPGPTEFTVRPEKIRVRESDLRKAMQAAEKIAADHAGAKARAQSAALLDQQANAMMFSKSVDSGLTAADQQRLVSKAAKEAVQELKAKMDQDRENEGMVRRAANEAAGAALKLMRQENQERSTVRRAAPQPQKMQQKSVRSPARPRRKQKLPMRKQSVSTTREKQKQKEKEVPRAPPPRREPQANFPAAAADIAKEVALKAYREAPTAPGVTQAARQAVRAANAAHWMSDAKQRLENAIEGGGPRAQRGKWMDRVAAQVELSQAIQQLPNRRTTELEQLPPFGAAPPPPQAPPTGPFPRRYMAAPEAQPTEEEEEDTSDEEEEDDTEMTTQSVGSFKAFPRRYTIDSQLQPGQLMANSDPSMASFPHKYTIETESQPAPLMADQMPAPFAAAPAITLDAHQRSYGGPPQSSPRETELMGAPPKSMPL